METASAAYGPEHRRGFTPKGRALLVQPWSKDPAASARMASHGSAYAGSIGLVCNWAGSAHPAIESALHLVLHS